MHYFRDANTFGQGIIPATLGAGFILDRLTTPRAVPDLVFFPRPCLLLISDFCSPPFFLFSPRFPFFDSCFLMLVLKSVDAHLCVSRMA